MQPVWRRTLGLFGAGALLTGLSVAGSASFGTRAAAVKAATTSTCSGTFATPGHLAGTFTSVQVTGVCQVDSGPALVTGSLTVAPGATLFAAFASNGSSLTVRGNLFVQSGATLVLGCSASEFSCLDDAGMPPTLNSAGRVGGSLISTNALGVIVHNSTIGGNVSQSGGGGGFNCDTGNPNPAFGFGVFSAYDDTVVGGSLSISNVVSCYMSVARVKTGGNMTFTRNQLNDADAIEILTNNVGGNLSCTGNSMVWDNVEMGPDPTMRVAVPINQVKGRRFGQCVLASPLMAGGTPGPGAF